MAELLGIPRREFFILAGGLVAGGWIATRDSRHACAEPLPDEFTPIKIPDWVRGVTRMTFVTLGEIERAAELGAQVCHTNAVWPYFPLRKEGGKLPESEASLLKEVVDRCHGRGMKLCLGLPPFPSVALVQAHPEWRVHPDDSETSRQVVPQQDNLGTRIGCNVSPWGDYLIEICAELMEDFGVDGYSFDGNYHPALCFCPACKAAYQADQGTTIPPRVNLDDVAYRKYLVWRGEQLERHYSRMQRRLKGIRPDAVVMSWTVNAGRYGHFLHSPRAMPTRLNQLFDLPMQEWWLDETNFGASVGPAFGAAYSRAVAGDRPAASEAYLMSRGNPYGTDSFPKHERVTRTLLAMTNGSVSAESMGWPGHQDSVAAAFHAVREREAFITNTRSLPWTGLLVSEQTRQFYAYRDIAQHFLPHVFGAFRVAMEEHLPLQLLNDWDLDDRHLSALRVLILPGSAALSDLQLEAIQDFVQNGGGLVATGESSLCDELGQARKNFGLARLLGVSYRGRPAANGKRTELDANFAVTVDESYWQQRVGIAKLSWRDHELFDDPRLKELVPSRSVTFKGPQVLVQVDSEPNSTASLPEVVARFQPDSSTGDPLPAIVIRKFGKGRVVYLATCVDAAMWSYAYPYQRRLFARCLEWAAGAQATPPIRVHGPMCLQTTYWEQSTPQGRRTLVHLFNGLNTTANHGLPNVDVPLREETVPIHGVQVQLNQSNFTQAHLEPGNQALEIRQHEGTAMIDLPPIDLHRILVLR